MDQLQALAAWLSAEGRVIWDAPYVFGLAVTVVVFLTWKTCAWLYTRDIETHKTTIDGLKTTHDAAMKLQEHHVIILKDENERLRRALDKSQFISSPPELIPVRYGNATVQGAAAEIRKDTVIFYGPPEQWSEEQISKFAAFSHLRQAGLANIEIKPTRATITATATLLNTPTILTYPDSDNKSS